MQMMVASNRRYSRASLRDAIVERFGADARFHTCAAENLTAWELIEFLAARGKFVEHHDGFTTTPDQICSH
jgi:probable metal-binding protein